MPAKAVHTCVPGSHWKEIQAGAVLSPSGALQCGGARESRDGNQISNEYADPHSSTHTTGILTHNAHPRRHDTAKMHFFGRSLALAVTVGVTAAVDVPFSSCSSSDALGVTKLVVSEWPIHPGHPTTFTVVFNPTKDIVSGTKLSAAVMIKNMQVFEHSVDMCSQTSLTCPLKAGEAVQVSATQTLPEGIPPVKDLKAVVQASDATGVISCTEVEIELAVGEYTLEHLGRLPAIDSSLVTDVLMSGTTWTPHFSPRFAGANLKQVQGMMGTWLRGHPLHMTLPYKDQVFGVTDKGDNVTIPESFDSREAWPACSEVIGKVKDQSACGSCWAFASSAAFEDRQCIVHGSKDLLSPTDTLACCSGMACGFSQGCSGGQPAGAWAFFASQGVVSGGLFEEVGSGDSCLPYPFLTCAHHVEPTEELPACPAEDFETPKCKHSCSEEEFEKDYKEDKRMGTAGYAVRAKVEEIQKEIMENGPVSAAFTVYQDFLAYSGEGVYTHVTGAPLGGHAVKLIGWGVENGTPYWLVVNSWNKAWGDEGLFRIIRGQDECGFESDITAGSV